MEWGSRESFAPPLQSVAMATLSALMRHPAALRYAAP
jgi:hypothetical protein